jgi:hypothetical protein
MENEIENDTGKAIPFVLIADKKFTITEEAKELLSNKSYSRIGIVSIVGKCLFLLTEYF